MNLPNRITLSRLFLSIFLFAILMLLDHQGYRDRLWAGIACAIFVIVAVTDALDGYLARKYDLVSDFGRIADPFVDKISVCGAFVFFCASPSVSDIVPAWLVVLIIAREFLVTALRGFVESKGVPFGADQLGKIKMVTQCVTISCVLFYFGVLPEVEWARSTLIGFMYATAGITLVSGISYLQKARRLIGGSPGMSRVQPKMNDWRLWVLTAGGLGLSPFAPGTVGTLAGVLLAALLPATSIGVAVGVLLIIVSAYFCVVLGNWAEANWGRKDPPSFVLDEVLGYLICVLPFLDAGWLGLAAAFVAFRLFDISKPPPVKRFEKLRGGWGVLADDAMAGLYGALLMAVLRFSGVI